MLSLSLAVLNQIEQLWKLRISAYAKPLCLGSLSDCTEPHQLSLENLNTFGNSNVLGDTLYTRRPKPLEDLMFFVQDSWIAQSANDTLVLTSAQGRICRYRLRSGQVEYKASPLSFWAVLTPNQTMQHLAINTAVGNWLREKSRWNLGPQLSQTA